MSKLKILVTGVYGLIAGAIYEHLRKQPEAYDVYGLARRRHPSVRVADNWSLDVPQDRFEQSDLLDLEQLTEAVRGMDVVVHLAAEPSPQAGWDKILSSNLVGMHNLFEACRRAGVHRVISASSIMVSFGYRQDEPYKAISEGRYADVSEPVPHITHTMPTRPLDIYASSKIWGEALAHTYAHRYGMSCLVLRIGWVVAQDLPPTHEAQPIWCSQRDIVQLIERCIHAPRDLVFDIFYGVSDNRWRWVDIEHAKRVLGYEPQDHGEDYVHARRESDTFPKLSSAESFTGRTGLH